MAGPETVSEKPAATPSALAVTVTGPLATATVAFASPPASVRTCAGEDRFAEPWTTAKLTILPASGLPRAEDPEAGPPQIREMLQTLPTDRFGLAAQWPRTPLMDYDPAVARSLNAMRLTDFSQRR